MFPLIVNFKKWCDSGANDCYLEEHCVSCKKYRKMSGAIHYHVSDNGWHNKIEILNGRPWCSPECLTLWLLTWEQQP
jgi:hypothetical protein